jgi:hypothetical protein
MPICPLVPPALVSAVVVPVVAVPPLPSLVVVAFPLRLVVPAVPGDVVSPLSRVVVAASVVLCAPIADVPPVPDDAVPVVDDPVVAIAAGVAVPLVVDDTVVAIPAVVAIPLVVVAIPVVTVMVAAPPPVAVPLMHPAVPATQDVYVARSGPTSMFSDG